MMLARTRRPAMRGVTIEPLRRRHLRQVLRIEALVYPRPWSAALFADELAQHESRRYLVAIGHVGGPLRPRVVVGYAGFLLQGAPDDGPEAHVTTIAVHPRHHRRKIATRLLLALLREARAMGASAATLEVRAANRGAQRLYSAFGFAPVALRPGYYAETGEDAVIMWLHDLGSDDMERRLARQETRLAEPGGTSGAPDDPVPWVRGRVGLDGRAR